MTLRKDFPYLYETHMHTCEASKCARSTGAQMAQAAKEAGYTGVIITDHNWYGNTDRTLHCYTLRIEGLGVLFTSGTLERVLTTVAQH